MFHVNRRVIILCSRYEESFTWNRWRGFFFSSTDRSAVFGHNGTDATRKKVDNRLSFFWICGGKVLENFGEIEGEKGEKNGRYFGLLYRHLWSLWWLLWSLFQLSRSVDFFGFWNVPPVALFMEHWKHKEREGGSRCSRSGGVNLFIFSVQLEISIDTVSRSMAARFKSFREQVPPGGLGWVFFVQLKSPRWDLEDKFNWKTANQRAMLIATQSNYGRHSNSIVARNELCVAAFVRPTVFSRAYLAAPLGTSSIHHVHRLLNYLGPPRGLLNPTVSTYGSSLNWNRPFLCQSRDFEAVSLGPSRTIIRPISRLVAVKSFHMADMTSWLQFNWKVPVAVIVGGDHRSGQRWRPLLVVAGRVSQHHRPVCSCSLMPFLCCGLSETSGRQANQIYCSARGHSFQPPIFLSISVHLKDAALISNFLEIHSIVFCFFFGNWFNFLKYSNFFEIF